MQSPQHIFSRPLILILLVAVVIRVGVLIALPTLFDYVSTGSVQGSDAYDIYAKNLLTTGIYGHTAGVPDAQIPPLYSYILALIYATLGRGYLQVMGFHILLDVLSMLVLYHIVRKLLPGSGPRLALMTVIFYAIYPYLIFQNLTLIDTPIFMTLLYALVLSAIILREQTSWNRTAWLAAFGTGISFGLTILARPVVIPLIAFVALWFLFRRTLRETVMRMVLVGVFALLIVSPWIIRNYTVYHSFVAVSNNGGMNFWFGNSKFTIPFLEAGYHPQWATTDEPVDANDRIANGQLFDISFTWLRQNLAIIPELLWVKFQAYWSIDVFPRKNPVNGKVSIVSTDSAILNSLPNNDPVAVYSDPLFDQVGRLVHKLYFGALMILALIGIALTAREWREVSLLWFLQISMTIVYVVFIPATRYRVPTDPALFAFSAYIVIQWYAVIKNKVPYHNKATNLL